MKDLETSSQTTGFRMAGRTAFGDVDVAVEAFEDARAGNRRVSFVDFLPERDSDSFTEVLQELIRVDLDHRFRETGEASIEDYRSAFPELFDQPEVIAPLAFEEYRLKLTSPQRVSPDEFARRYRVDTSRWPRSGEESSSKSSSSPIDSGVRAEFAPGQQLLDFQIVGELGRGAFSRVYLAQQMTLSNRLVVLKVSSSKLREAERLAKLQHTNIVPVYSVHQYQKFSIICMPWFGSTTLKDVVRSLASERSLKSSDSVLSGQMLLSTVAACDARTKTDLGASETLEPHRKSPALSMVPSQSPLLKLGAEQSAVWIVMKLAEGLAHAHTRGILHRDMKPANVLLAEDGQPMILDFNLAAEQEDLTDAIAGGTLPYMSPEQIASVESYREISATSDVYSLGVMLFELLSGRLPFLRNSGSMREMIEERRATIPQVREINPRLSVDVNSIVALCLQPDPAQRYQSAADLAEDLQRHLDNFPLRHAANRSLPERLSKWIRRHPQLTSSSGILAVSLAFVSIAGVAWWRSNIRLRNEQTQREVSEFLNRKPMLEAEAFAAAFGEVARPETASLLNSAIAPFLSIDRAPSLAALDASKRQELANAIEDVQFLAAELTETSSNSTKAADSPIDDSSGTKPDDRQRIRNATQAVLNRDFESAATLLEPITQSRPDDAAALLLRGMSLMELSEGGNLDAEALLTAAIALNPDSVQNWYQRGLCRFAMKKFAAAIDDFSQVMELEPTKLNALVSRAICLMNLGRLDESLADLTKAIESGFPGTRVYFLRASVYRMKNDAESADRDKAKGLSLTPTDAESWVSRGLEQLPENPEKAIQDFREAQKLHPESHDAFRNLAMVLSEYLKRPDEAITVQNEAIRFHPRDAYLWVGRAVLKARAGQRDDAVQDAEKALELSDEPLVIYSAACVYALTSTIQPDDATVALKHLAASIKSDHSLANMAFSDVDLKPISTRPEFRNILAAAQILSGPLPTEKP